MQDCAGRGKEGNGSLDNLSESGSTPGGARTLCASACRSQVAALKRVFELWVLDRDFHDAFSVDPAGALARTGLGVDLRAASYLLSGKPEEANAQAEPPEAFVWFRDLIEGRIRNNMFERANVLPDDPRFRDWNLRQQRRCERELGSRGKLMMHLPVAFELSSGCSVGCPFCALSAGRLKGIFRYTEENAALWRDVLTRVRATVGDAARRGICYYATEPLDNPDYELFLEDFHREFGCVPQTTTAVATRDTERTRRLLRWGQETCEHFDRISVLSEKDRDVLLAAFTPDELVFTDLLPQFDEAPGANFTKAGRNVGEGESPKGTIACVSGFVVNMWERSIRLVTPVPASDEHPTGELAYETAHFVDGAGLEGAIQGMIKRHMHETIELADILKTSS